METRYAVFTKEGLILASGVTRGQVDELVRDHGEPVSRYGSVAYQCDWLVVVGVPSGAMEGNISVNGGGYSNWTAPAPPAPPVSARMRMPVTTPSAA